MFYSPSDSNIAHDTSNYSSARTLHHYKTSDGKVITVALYPKRTNADE
jgi:hypothetical protein